MLKNYLKKNLFSTNRFSTIRRHENRKGPCKLSTNIILVVARDVCLQAVFAYLTCARISNFPRLCYYEPQEFE